MLLIVILAQSKLKCSLLNYNRNSFLWVRYFMFGEFVCCLLSKIPSHLYKFVQLSGWLRGRKKNQFTLKSTRNKITLASRNLPALSKLLNIIKHCLFSCSVRRILTILHVQVCYLAISLWGISMSYFYSYNSSYR